MSPGRPDATETARLLDLARSGDEAAVNQLLAIHRAYVRRVVEMRMHPRLSARLDPSDVVQESLLDAARRIRQYLKDAPIEFHLWLRQAACDRLADLNRKHLAAECRAVDREVALSQGSSILLAGRLSSGEDNPLKRLMEEELAERVRHALGLLAEQDAEVVVLRTVEGLTNQESAQVLGIEPAAASKRYTRALLRLAELLRNLLNEERPR